MPEKAILKSHINKLWHVKVGRIDNKLFFQNGWDRFVQDNLIENGDFLVFRYNGDYVFDVKILGKSGCEKGMTGTYLSIDKRPSYIKEEEEEEDVMVMDKEEQEIEAKEKEGEGEEEEEDDDEEEEEEDDDDDDDDYEEEEEKDETEEEEEEEEENVSGAKPINKSRGQKNNQ